MVANLSREVKISYWLARLQEAPPSGKARDRLFKPVNLNEHYCQIGKSVDITTTLNMCTSPLVEPI